MNSPEDTNDGPVIRDLRRIDPVTGQVRDPQGRRDGTPGKPGRPGRHSASKPSGTGARPAAPGGAAGAQPPGGGGAGDERMRREELGETLSEGAGSVAVDYADAGAICQGGFVEEFVDAAGGFFDG